MSELIVVACEGGILRIELNRAEKKNALTAEMYDAIANALAQADSSADIRVMLVHGQHDCFTAGNDLREFRIERQAPQDTPVRRFLDLLPRLQKPLIAAVAGPAVGIGTTMLLHFDLVYAASNARFHLPFIDLAAVPEAGASMLLPRLVGYHRAAELLLLGRPFEAQEAYRLGLVSRVVSADALMSEALGAARALAAKPPAALVATKALLRREPEPIASRIDEENEVFSERMASPEFQQAINAFLERRKADFS